MKSKMEEEVGKLKEQLTAEQGKLHAKKKAMSNLQNSHVRQGFALVQHAVLTCQQPSVVPDPLLAAVFLVKSLFPYPCPANASCQSGLLLLPCPCSGNQLQLCPPPSLLHHACFMQWKSGSFQQAHESHLMLTRWYIDVIQIIPSCPCSVMRC